MIHATPTIRNVLSDLSRRAPAQRPARTLMGTRFVDFPEGKDDKVWRRRTAEAVRQGATDNRKLHAWQAFATSIAGGILDSQKLLFVRQESRLMVDMAGGVFENGGLCLDRVSGIPYIPGSAIKGCARRTALAALHDYEEAGSTDEETWEDAGFFERPLDSLSKAFDSREDFLFAISLIFGWSDLEWKGEEDFGSASEWAKKRPDFAWACGESWEETRAIVTNRLCEHLGIKAKMEDRPWRDLVPFAGSIAFLPAFPWETDPGIELEILTPHHKEYYESDAPNAIATDTEDPVPVAFPAVSPGGIWAFLMDETTRALPGQLDHAKRWLTTGLDVFGIGAKTNAGYGRFDASEETHAAEVERLRIALAAREKARELADQKASEEKRRKEKAEQEKELEKELAGLSPEQREDLKLAKLTNDQFDGKVRSFCKGPKKGGPSDAEKEAIVRALRDSRLAYWENFKAQAEKGPLAAVANEIRALSKSMNLGKMP